MSKFSLFFFCTRLVYIFLHDITSNLSNVCALFQRFPTVFIKSAIHFTIVFYDWQSENAQGATRHIATSVYSTLEILKKHNILKKNIQVLLF